MNQILLVLQNCILNLFNQLILTASSQPPFLTVLYPLLNDFKLTLPFYKSKERL